MQKNNPYRLKLSRYSTHNIIRKNIGIRKVVLDVGCNEGYLKDVSDISNVFYGVDCLRENIQEAEKKYKGAILYNLNTLNVLPWNIKFDVIVFADVLEHVFFPENVISFFVERYLKEGGEVIISLPNVANWQVRSGLFFGNFDYKDAGILDKTHLHLYTFKTARELIKKNGLKVMREYGGASFFGFLLRGLPFLKGMLATNIIYICRK